MGFLFDNSDDVDVRIELLNDISLVELILKVCKVGVPVLLGGSDLPVSSCCVIFESMFVQP